MARCGERAPQIVWGGGYDPAQGSESCPPSQKYPSTYLLSDGSGESIRKPWLRAETPKKTRMPFLLQ